MTATQSAKDPGPRAPYAAPALRRLGDVASLTQARTKVGGPDGGPNNTRSGL